MFKLDISKVHEELKGRLSAKELCSRLRELFFITDHYGFQTKAGYYVANYKYKLPDVSDEVIYLSLKGDISIAAYSINKQSNLCKYLAIDFDEPSINNTNRDQLLKEMQPVVKDVIKEMKQFGFRPYLEYSGNKGYHVFVFFSEPIDANIAYDLCRYFVRDFRPRPECFPKQRNLINKSVGNCIRMPMCINRKTGMRSEWLNHDFIPYDDQARFTLRGIIPTSIEVINQVYNKIEDYVKANQPRSNDDVIQNEAITHGDPFGIEITGPGQRNGQTFKFVARCKGSKMMADQARIIGRQWLSKYKQYFAADLYIAEQELDRIVNYVYQISV